VADVLEAVAAGTAQLVPVEPDGVIVTRLVQEPGRLVCLVWLASGDLEPLLERYVDIEAWAAARAPSRCASRAAPAGCACCPGSSRRA
jgi:hypothetical protein